MWQACPLPLQRIVSREAVIAILIALLTPLSAEAQQPQQTPRVSSDQKSNRATKSQSQRSTEPRGPVNPSAVIHQSQSVPSAQQSGHDPNKATQEATEFWTMLGRRVKITDSLVAIFTLFLVIANMLLWRSTDKLWRASRRTSEISEGAANAAQQSAEAALELTHITHASEAPYLIPRFLELQEPTGHRVRVLYTFANEGKTPAVIMRFQDTLRLIAQLPDNPDGLFFEKWENRREEYFAVGPSHAVRDAVAAGTFFLCRLHRQDQEFVGDVTRQFYLVGRVEYADLLGNRREQRFCWMIDTSNGVCFEWDPKKGAENLRKHRIAFEEASTVFGNPFAITFPDPDHSLGERRSLTFGLSRPS